MRASYSEVPCAHPSSMDSAICGADVFGLDPQSGGWALSRCTEDLAAIAIGGGFVAAFLGRLARRDADRAGSAPPVQAGSIYAKCPDSDEAEGLLSPTVQYGPDEALIASLAADRRADAVEQLRGLADADIFKHESVALRKAAYALAASGFALRCWNAWFVLLGAPSSPSFRIVAASILELLAWLTCLATARAETTRCQPRSSLVMAFWAVSMFAPASTLLRSLSWRDDGSAADSTGEEEEAVAAQLIHACPSAVVCTLLICVAVATVWQHNRSSIWQAYQGAWSMQREGNGDGALDRLMGLQDTNQSAEGREQAHGSGWCPEKSGANGASIFSKVRRLVRLGRPDACYIWLGISGFVLHASSKVWYQLLWGRLINAVYAGDREAAVANSWQILLASMMAVWFDQYASIFLSIGGARLSVRLQRHVFNLIMEQDAAFFDRVKTGSLMTILSTNVGSIQNVLVHQTADLAEGIAVTVILLLYMLVREWRLTLVLVASTVVPMGVNAVIGWIAERKTELLMAQQAAQSTVAVSALLRTPSSCACVRTRMSMSTVVLPQEEQIGEVRTVKSLGHEDYAKELYKQRADATFKTQVRLTILLAPLEGIVDSLFDGEWPTLNCEIEVSDFSRVTPETQE